MAFKLGPINLNAVAQVRCRAAPLIPFKKVSSSWAHEGDRSNLNCMRPMYNSI